MKLFIKCFIALLLSLQLFSQNTWTFSQNKNKIVIPFLLENNSIVLQAKVNNTSLNLILDTGSAYNMLFAFPEKDSVTFYNTSKIKITGPGSLEPMDAYLSRNNKIELKSISSNKLDIILMLEDKYSFTTSIGLPIHGILGADFFKENIVEIQYHTKRIVVYKKETSRFTKKLQNFKQIPFILNNDKPFMPILISIDDTKKQNLQMLIDTGLSDGIWLFEKQLNFDNKKKIEDYLGAGIGGDVFGKRVRLNHLSFSEFEFKNPIISIPDTISFLKKNILMGRDGSLGGEILKRFTVVFNYQKKIMHLSKNNNFDNTFYYNMAGFEIHHSGIDVVEEKIEESKILGAKNVTDIIFDNPKVNFKYVLKPGIEIFYVRKNSIADKAGLKVEDKIISINNRKAASYKLSEIVEIFHKNINEVITIVVERKGKVFVVNLELLKEI